MAAIGRQLTQLRLLLWMNLTGMRKQRIALAAQILVPLATFGVIGWLGNRYLIKSTPVAAKQSTLFELEKSSDNRTCPNVPGNMKLAYAPNTSRVLELMESTSFKNNLMGFKNAQELSQHAANPASGFEENFIGAVLFDDDFAKGAPTGSTIRYTLRPTSAYFPTSGFSTRLGAKQWRTSQTYPDTHTPFGLGSFYFGSARTDGWLQSQFRLSLTEMVPDYWCSGILRAQNEVDKAIRLQLMKNASSKLFTANSSSGSGSATSASVANAAISISAFPYPAINEFGIMGLTAFVLAVTTTMGFGVAVMQLTRRIVQEKELRLKEYMRAMGLSRTINWCGHFICSAMLNVPLVAIYTIVLSLIYLKASDGLLIFLFLLLYVVTFICFAFVISCCFKSGNWATISAFLLNVASLAPWLASQFVVFPYFGFLLAMLLPNSAMAFGFQTISLWEKLSVGLVWKYVSTTPTITEELCMADVFLMQILQTLLFLLLTFYIEAVFPGHEGVPQPLYFPFQLSYWFPQLQSKNVRPDSALAKRRHSRSNSIPADPSAYEEYPSGIDADITIEGLKKVFAGTGPKVVAVKNLSLNIFHGQITALLGHNGAGKSTTMAMLTGLTPPSAGSALIKGYDIGSHVDQARQFIGLCPQYNVYHNTLSVLDHLKFFCQLKGRKYDRDEALGYLRSLGMEHAQNFLPTALSGGMKRKLCLCVALIGGSEVVMLDEPTSGMDPGARHDVWTFLQKEKHNRTILLSTHYMEEADVLGDRIAILANGRLACSGTPLFLKRRYGAGYHLTVAFTDDKAREQRVGQVVTYHCAKAKLESNIGTEASYLLPTDERDKFRGLFTELEAKQSELGVSSFGVSVTTMDEVFIKVGEITDIGQATHAQEFDLESYKKAAALPDPLTGPALLLQQVRSQFVKRFAICRRSFSILIAQLLVPSAFFIISTLIFLKKDSPVVAMGPVLTEEEQPLRLSIAPFSGDMVLLATSPDGKSAGIIDILSKKLGSDLVAQSVDASSIRDLSALIEDRSSAERPAMFRRRNILSIFLNASRKAELQELTLFFNDDPYHSAPIGLNLLSNILLRLALQSDAYTIETTLHPYAKVYQNQTVQISTPAPRVLNASGSLVRQVASSSSASVFVDVVAFVLMVGVSILAGSLTMIVVKERINSAKQLQFIAGLSPATYWLSAIFSDFLCYLVPVAFFFIALATLGAREAMLAGDGWAQLLLLCVLHGIALPPFAYLVSYLFERVLTAFIGTLLITYLLSYTPLLAFVANFGKAPDTSEDKKDFTVIFDALFPHLSFNHGITGYVKASQSWSSTYGRCCCFLAIQAVAYTGILLAKDYRLFRRLRQNGSSYTTAAQIAPEQAGGDVDIADERSRVLQPKAGETPPALAAKSLVKSYQTGGRCKPTINTRAVNELTFGVNQGECFGLLGVNGAGKTSTFQMLTGVLAIDSGDAAVGQLSLKNSPFKATCQLGYCPQFDALIDVLTVTEILRLFARLRGYPEERISGLVSEMIKATGLEKHALKLDKNLSGGNRRKLSFGVALLGNPIAVILDEPTAGIDPVARRSLWKVVDGAKQMGISVLLSSHSMEECEALCTRIAILAKGSLKCLGTAQHLKSKFGAGYTLLLRVASEEKRPNVLNAMKTLIPNASLKEQHQLQLSYWISRDGNSWSAVFGHAEDLQNRGLISDFSASQSTLEQVFLSLTHEAQQTTVAITV